MKADTYNAVVVGTGQAGKPLATALARAGHQTAIIERGRVGGTCVISGCTPSKTMIASARIAHLARRAAEYGVATGEVAVDLDAVRSRKRDVVEEFSTASRDKLVDEPRVTLIRGDASFVGKRTLEIDAGDGDTRRIVGERIFLDVGTRPLVPDIEGLEAIPFLDSTSAMELAELPSHLAVLGGGPIGVELGQMFRRFGSKVTIVERGPSVLPDEDDDIGEELGRLLEDEGVRIISDATARRVRASGDDGLTIELEAGSEEELHASHLLVAVGRHPNTDTLGLEKPGVALDEDGYIEVDERCRTSVDWIWAMGEATGSPPFTHVAYDDYRVVAGDVIRNGHGRMRDRSDRMVPYVIFTDPELGRVGLGEREARAAGRRFRVAKLPMSSVARAIETDQRTGFLKCLVEDETDRILGAAALAVHGGEIMSVLQLAMMGGLPFTAIRDGVLAHPTLAEALQALFGTLEEH